MSQFQTPVGGRDPLTLQTIAVLDRQRDPRRLGSALAGMAQDFAGARGRIRQLEREVISLRRQLRETGRAGALIARRSGSRRG